MNAPTKEELLFYEGVLYGLSLVKAMPITKELKANIEAAETAFEYPPNQEGEWISEDKSEGQKEETSENPGRWPLAYCWKSIFGQTMSPIKPESMQAVSDYINELESKLSLSKAEKTQLLDWVLERAKGKMQHEWRGSYVDVFLYEEDLREIINEAKGR